MAVVLDTAGELCIERAGARAERQVRADVVRQQLAALEEGMDAEAEGFSRVIRVKCDDQVEITRVGASGSDRSS